MSTSVQLWSTLVHLKFQMHFWYITSIILVQFEYIFSTSLFVYKPKCKILWYSCLSLVNWNGDTCRTVCTVALHRKTNPNPDPNQYRRHCPDPNARIQKFIHYMVTTPQWVVLQNSMQIEFTHTYLHTTPEMVYWIEQVIFIIVWHCDCAIV